jgi:8-oxo-dGTP pyrophosphatase MutT (NUDIX family)
VRLFCLGGFLPCKRLDLDVVGHVESAGSEKKEKGTLKKWEVLKREKILETPWITMYRDVVKTNDGVLVKDYYTFMQHNTAMVLPITEGGDVVLVREYRHGCGDYVWQLPAGKIGADETALDAAKRELLEETGYEVDRLELLGSWYISPPRMPDKEFVFVGENARRASALDRDETEEMEIKEVPFAEAVQMVLDSEIKDPHSCVAILRFERKKCES